jgi:hypothetical protein
VLITAVVLKSYGNDVMGTEYVHVEGFGSLNHCLSDIHESITDFNLRISEFYSLLFFPLISFLPFLGLSPCLYVLSNYHIPTYEFAPNHIS